MASVDYKDLTRPNDKTMQTSQMLASNAAHLAKLLKASRYPGIAH